MEGYLQVQHIVWRSSRCSDIQHLSNLLHHHWTRPDVTVQFTVHIMFWIIHHRQLGSHTLYTQMSYQLSQLNTDNANFPLPDVAHFQESSVKFCFQIVLSCHHLLLASSVNSSLLIVTCNFSAMSTCNTSHLSEQDCSCLGVL